MKKRGSKQTVQEYSLLKKIEWSSNISFFSLFCFFSSILCSPKQRREEFKKGKQEKSWSNFKNIGVSEQK